MRSGGTANRAWAFAVAALIVSACSPSEPARVDIAVLNSGAEGPVAWIEVDPEAAIERVGATEPQPVARLEADSVVAVRAVRCPGPVVLLSHRESGNTVSKTFPPESIGTDAYSLPSTPGGERVLDVYLPDALGRGLVDVQVGCENSYDVVGRIESVVIDVVDAQGNQRATATFETIGDSACLDRFDGSDRCQEPTVELPVGTGATP